MDLIKKESTESNIILCPNCSGLGATYTAKRTSAYDTKVYKEICHLCDGKRVVVKEVTTKYKVVE